MKDIYRVRQFVSYVTPSENAILQNDSGIVKIVDKNLIQFTSLIDKEGIKFLEPSNFEKFFPDNANDVIKFLLVNNIIERPPFYNFNLQEINFISNDKKVGELTDQVLKECLDKTYQYVLTNDIASSINIEHNTNSFWIVFMNPYSKKEAKKIRDRFVNAKNTYLLTSYIYNNTFYIDSIYSSEFKTPCHLCQINIIESELRGNANSKRMNYQKLVDLLYKENETFNIELSLSAIQTINLVSQLCNRILQHIGAEKNLKTNLSLFGEGHTMNLKSFKTHTDTTMHWELCDCYE